MATESRISADDAAVFIVAGCVLCMALGLAAGLAIGHANGRRAEKADQFLREAGAEVLSSGDGVERYRVVRFPKP